MRALVIGDQGEIGASAAANVRAHRHGASAGNLGSAFEHRGGCDVCRDAARDDAVAVSYEPRLCEQSCRARRDAGGVCVRVDRGASRVHRPRAGDGACVHAGRCDRSFARSRRVVGACRDRDLRRASRFDRRHRLSALVRVGDRDRSRDAPFHSLVRAPQTPGPASRRAVLALVGDFSKRQPAISQYRSGRWSGRRRSPRTTSTSSRLSD